MTCIVNPYMIAPPVTYSAQAQAVFNRMVTVGAEPDSTRKGFLAAFVDSLVAAGVWVKLDLLYLLSAHAEAASMVNLVAPGTYDLTKINTPSFTVDGGWTSAATSYLDSGFNPSTAVGKKLSQNDLAAGFGVLTDAADSNNLKSLGGVATIRTIPRAASGNWLQGGGATALDTALVGNTGKGLYGFSRAAGTAFTPQKNGVAQSAISRASATPTSANFLLLTADGTNLTGKQVSLGFLGQALTDAEHTSTWSAYSTFMTAIGVSPT